MKNTYEYSQPTIDLVRDEIKRWADIRIGLTDAHHSESKLCSTHPGCAHCPIKEITGAPDCECTPYYVLYLEKRAREMISLLQDIYSVMTKRITIDDFNKKRGKDIQAWSDGFMEAFHKKLYGQ